MTQDTNTLEGNGTLTTSSNTDILFSAIFSAEGDDARRRKNELITSLNIAQVFKNEYYVYYILTREHTKITPNKAFIDLFLRSNRATFQKNQNIILSDYQTGETDPYIEFVNSTIQLFNDLKKVKVSDEDYSRTIEMIKMEYINEQSINILEESTMVLAEGVQRGRKVLTGYDDMRSNLKSRFVTLDNMVKKKDRKGLVAYGLSVEDEEAEDEGLKLVTTFGIEGLDNALGGIYEGDMVSLLAPAKGCKSRFATYVLHTALVQHGTNIAVWSIENGYKGWEALIRARHFNWFYNSKVQDPTQKRLINSDMIRKGTLPPELKEMERASWADLKSNPNYGRIINIDENFESDSYKEVLDSAVDEFGAKLLCLDYLQLVTGGDARMSKNERIGETYKEVLQYLKNRKLGGIMPAQLKQSAVGDIKRMSDDDIANMDLRDAAGESYEVIKTPDVNISLWGTPQDIKNGHMKLLSIPSRNSAVFSPIDLYVDAGTCSFADITGQI